MTTGKNRPAVLHVNEDVGVVFVFVPVGDALNTLLATAAIHYGPNGAVGVHSYHSPGSPHRLSLCLPVDPDMAIATCDAIKEGIAMANELARRTPA